MPWLFVLIILLFHLPACIMRVLHWESAQYLALGLAIFGVALSLQAYGSTKLAAAEILVWMPIFLTLDFGAMMQMIVLILREHTGQDTSAVDVLWNAMKTMTWALLFAMGAEDDCEFVINRAQLRETLPR